MFYDIINKLHSLLDKRIDKEIKLYSDVFERRYMFPQKFHSSRTNFCPTFHFPPFFFFFPTLFFSFMSFFTLFVCVPPLSLPITQLLTLPSRRRRHSPRPNLATTHRHRHRHSHRGRRRPPPIQTPYHHIVSSNPFLSKHTVLPPKPPSQLNPSRSPPPPLPPIKPSSPTRKGTIFFNKKSKLISFGLLLIFMLYCYSIFK